MTRLQRDYLPHHLAPLLAQQQLQGSIVVQARQCVAETQQLLQWAEQQTATQVVGWIDVTAADLATQLSALHHPRLRGFRHLVQDERDPAGWLVLDHLGKPDISRGARAWGEQVAELAAMPHVVCKLSGLVTEAPHGEWHRDQLQPFIEEALVRFGPQRLMFGSDWPVCLLAAEYPAVAQLVAEAIATLSADEQAAIWGTTAAQVYGLTGENNESVFAG